MFIRKNCSFNSLKVVIQKNAFNSTKAVIRFTKSCHLIQKHGYNSTKAVIQVKKMRSIHKSCYSIQKNEFNSFKVVIQENTFNSQKVFIRKKCSFTKSVDSIC